MCVWPQSQKVLRRFKWHTLGLIAGLIVVHVGMFALMHVLITRQENEVMDLNRVGESEFLSP